jgi:hypothetical protein
MTTCPLCKVGHQPVKLRRQWVHHFACLGRIIICHAKLLKPGS